MNKKFNGKKYYLSRNRWIATLSPQTSLTHDVWNYYNPNDKIVKGDGYHIHHKNEDPSDDRIENLQKMTREKHRSFHQTKENHSLWKGGIKQTIIYLGGETIEKNCSYTILQSINSLGEVKVSYFNLTDKRDL